MTDADDRPSQPRPARPPRPAAPSGARRRTGVLARREPSGIGAARFTIPTCLIMALLLPTLGVLTITGKGPASLKGLGDAAPTILIAAGLIAAGAAGLLMWQVTRHYR